MLDLWFQRIASDWRLQEDGSRDLARLPCWRLGWPCPEIRLKTWSKFWPYFCLRINSANHIARQGAWYPVHLCSAFLGKLPIGRRPSRLPWWYLPKWSHWYTIRNSECRWRNHSLWQDYKRSLRRFHPIRDRGDIGNEYIYFQPKGTDPIYAQLKDTTF